MLFHRINLMHNSNHYVIDKRNKWGKENHFFL